MSKAAELAALIGSQTALSNRNMIINGAMQVAQRGTSNTGVTSGGYLNVDRFKYTLSSSGTFTISQSSIAPEGFATSIGIECTTADASPNYLFIETPLEGQDLQTLKKGTSNAESITFSFYVRSSKTGTYQLTVRDSDNSRQIGATYTIDAANTWERKIITFPGDTTGTLDNDNAKSMEMEWWLASGSTYNSGAVPTAWEAQANGDRAAGLTVNIGASTSDNFYITGIQMEVGEQATPFEHRSFGDELARCQRYFYRAGTTETTSSMVTNNMIAYSTTAVQGGERFPVEMRGVPSLSIAADGSGFLSISFGSGTFTTTSTSFAGNASSRQSSNHWIGGFSGLTAGNNYFMFGNNNSVFIDYDSEL